MELVAIFGDGQLYDAWQLAPNGGWSAWAPLAGQDLRGPVALATNADGRLEAFVVGGDGNVYHRWQSSPNGWNGWSGWSNLIDPRLMRVEDLRAVLAGNGCLTLVLMTTSGTLSSLSQVVPNGGWGAPLDLYGHSLQWPCALGKTADGRLEVAVIGGDRSLYSRWQVDPARPHLWSNWTPLGGRDLHPGVAFASNHLGQLEFFVIGGDRALYRGPRGV